MKKNFEDKSLKPETAENKGEEILQEYHFAGGTEYQPMTIKAKSREEAEEIYEKEKQKV